MLSPFLLLISLSIMLYKVSTPFCQFDLYNFRKYFWKLPRRSIGKSRRISQGQVFFIDGDERIRCFFTDNIAMKMLREKILKRNQENKTTELPLVLDGLIEKKNAGKSEPD